jgi:uncharacterized membrane protein YciS (DUF1049 family)
MENESKIWNKKQTDLTVGETMKLAAVVTVASMAAAALPLAVFYGIEGVKNWRLKRQLKKLEEDIENAEKV